MKKYSILQWTLCVGSTLVLAASCVKDPASDRGTPIPVVQPLTSFVEEFDSVGRLPARGWVLRNNSEPAGQTGWRQGRYEQMPLVTPATKKGGFTGPTPYLGFTAYSARLTPQDFISCDITALGDPTGGGGNISAWLISPQVPMRTGDQIVFWTRSIDDATYPVATRDRVQVRVSPTGSADVGYQWSDTGSFTVKVLDINQAYGDNFSGGYPQAWRRYTITLPAGLNTASGRFAFRYYAEDAGFFGGSAGTNYPSLVGIDSLAYIRK